MTTATEKKIPDWEVLGQYRYRLFNSRCSSARLGDCEVCNKYVSDVFHQIEEREYEPKAWTQHECNSYFGHRDCLLGKRRSKEA